MTEPIHEGPPPTENPSVRVEERDARFKPIFLLLIVSAILGVVIFLIVWTFFRDYGAYQDRIKRSPYPLAPTPSTALPRGPRLEQLNRDAGIETGNIHHLQAAYAATLHSYGRTEKEGYVRVPIERAAELLANRLPARQAQPAGMARRSSGLVGAGESSAGRLFRKEEP